ncbi:MAG TPA: divalent-cation tolerance protein CutA [Pyrinomonadaceae bacterium]|nr:divalent-cation tolerance protein CutA [Pyrinomonadaceae bacterium]
MSEAIVVFMTAGNAAEAQRIADRLVETKLAACVQILPEIQSVYRWKNEVQHEKEVLLLAKTTEDRFVALEKEVRALHSYETPEIVAVPAKQVSEPYRAWLLDSLS